MPTFNLRALFRNGCFLLIWFLAGSTALALPAGVTQGPSVEGTTQYSLDNGLQILLSPDASKPTTTVNMTYFVGSRNENYGETGMAHLLEHMLFRGTPSLRNALAEFSRRGLAANGSTTSDRTDYYASFAADPETLDWYIQWQADAMVNSLIAKEDLDAEMTVVRNEMESGENSPFRILMQQMRAAAYQWHSYGKDTIGARSDVEQVDIQQLRAFYHQYYQPDNAILIISGQFEPDAVLQVIATAFGKIPRPSRSLPPEYTVEPVQDGERRVTLRRHGGSPFVAAMFHIPSAGDPDYIPLDLGVSMLADTPSGRLYRDLVGQKLSANVFGFARDMRQPGYALFGAQLEPGMDPWAAIKALNASIASLAAIPFTQEELDRIKNKWLTGWDQVYANPSSLTRALSDAAAAGDWRLFFLQRDLVDNATLERVQEVTQQYLVASNRTDGLYIPTDKPVRAPAPGDVNLASVLKDYTGRETPEDVAAFDPSPENIDASTLRAPLELPNGAVQLALLPKPTRGDRVYAKLLIQFGDAQSLKGLRAISSTTAALLDHGTQSLTRQQIEDKFDALKADVYFNGGAGNVVVDMSTTGDKLPAVVEAVLDVVRNASFPAKELAEYQRQASASIKSSMAEPSALAARTLARYDNPWPSDDIRYVPTFEEALEEIAAVTQKDLADFHAKFYGAGTIRFSAVGDFEPNAVKTALSHGLDGWKKAPAYTRISEPYRPTPPKAFTINTPDKANAFYLATLPLKIQDTDPRYPALYVANYLLGSSETSRLWNRVRVQDGLSYNIRSNFDASSYEPSGDWTLYAIHAPENSKKLEDAIETELELALKDGFTDQEVQSGVDALLKLRRLARTRDGTLASAWLGYLQLDRSFEWSAHIDEALASLTADDVNAALRAVLKPDQFSTAVAGDFKKN